MFDSTRAHRTLMLLVDATALQMDHLFGAGRGFISEMNRWTGSYLLTEQPRRSDEAGLAAGRLFLCHLATGDQRFLDWATHIVDGIASAVEKADDHTHASMDLYYGLCWGANITGNRRWARAATQSIYRRIEASWSVSANRFVTELGNGSVAAIEGLAWNAPLLAWAMARDSEFAPYLHAVLDLVLEVGLVRADGSSHHVAEFDADHQFRRFSTYQGYSEASTWARGHAWGMHGFLIGWEATREQRYLEAARAMTDWWISRTREDAVPFYDFDDPDVPEVPRDSCAAAIAADVMLRLRRAVSNADLVRGYSAGAEATMAELASNYLSPGGVLLHGSSGKIRETVFGRRSSRLPPDRAPDMRTTRFPMEEVMPYGNMFILSALFRHCHEDWTAIDVDSV